jgi:hypothetical protein
MIKILNKNKNIINLFVSFIKNMILLITKFTKMPRKFTVALDNYIFYFLPSFFSLIAALNDQINDKFVKIY